MLTLLSETFSLGRLFFALASPEAASLVMAAQRMGAVRDCNRQLRWLPRDFASCLTAWPLRDNRPSWNGHADTNPLHSAEIEESQQTSIGNCGAINEGEKTEDGTTGRTVTCTVVDQVI